MEFEKYPFQKLKELLDGITPNSEYMESSLTIGEPQFDTPQFILDELSNKAKFLNKYPKSAGEDFLKEAQLNFIEKRFGVKLDKTQIIPTFGTREVLFNFPQYFLFDKSEPTIAFTNPFYQIYEGAAKASRAKVIHINLTKENDFIGRLSDEDLAKCDLVIINYPNNPTSSTASMEELVWWVEKSLEFDFVLINDECYSELYFDEAKKPISLLEASIKAGNESFKNILVLNSISKRSSAPGLRSGIVAGDSEILKEYMKYRTYVGAAVPLPIQYASAKAWSDEEHVKMFQQNYKENFEIAKDILGTKIPEATFYIWLEVDDEMKFTKELYEKKNIKVLPGSFLGRAGIGKGYVRIALVESPQKTKEVLDRLKGFIDEYNS